MGRALGKPCWSQPTGRRPEGNVHAEHGPRAPHGYTPCREVKTAVVRAAQCLDRAGPAAAGCWLLRLPASSWLQRPSLVHSALRPQHLPHNAGDLRAGRAAVSGFEWGEERR